MATSSGDIVLNNITQIFHGAVMRSTGGEFRAVDDVSFTLSADPPSIVSLVGQSGSGKSTIARIILGLQKPTQGSVTYRGKDIYKLSAHEYDAYRQEIQPVFQDPYGIFNPFYRVDRVFWTAIKKFKLAGNRQQALSKIEESLHAVDLRPEDVLNRYPHQLSGGQRQRVMLARVHLLQPRFIIADEPISMLDAAVRVLFLNILIDFQQKYGMTTLFITHDLSTAYYVGGEILVMSKGQIVERGDIDDVLVHPTHPYTKMLLSSIPIPDPDARWQDKTSLVDIEGATPDVALPDIEVPR
ncbi:ABC transporter ATP-binding protein [Dictyobacter sp. S3.2.2.5]|uniref:ABC transporter ATP-binding protein n=1 Tax=Dictyobacter halimunensis TaxID=3026934 RepID=A0ABQ6FPU6_9CHLR|nr:ABC transporter ATP-binding protein [Dictyobacter sp. S3.2.2.5]